MGDAGRGLDMGGDGATYHNLGDILLMAKQVRWEALMRKRRHESIP